jgi:tRNA modification GTPase
MTPTIAAVATAPGPAGIAVVRISGPQTQSILERVVRTSRLADHPREMRRIRVHGPENDEAIDDGLGVFFPGPRSFTGEDMAELHVHGGSQNVRRVLSAILQHGATPARPGEFSERAYANGKLDLAGAEAIQALIHSRSTAAARVARRQIDGALGRALADAGAPLQDVLARIEAAIDFPEEIGDPDPKILTTGIDTARQRIQRLLDDARFGRKLHEGAVVVLAGAPNAGKSSLLNRLAGSERAIVTELPGTTRDLLREEIDIHGIPVTVVDTAGLRTTSDRVEAIGVERATDAMETADLVVHVRDSTEPIAGGYALPRSPDLVVWTKIDLLINRESTPASGGDTPECLVSGLTGDGIEALRAQIAKLLAGTETQADAELPVVSNSRHEHALGRAAAALDRAGLSVSDNAPVDCVAVDLHDALLHLGSITGGSTREDVIRSIFATFCLGK